MFVKVRLRMGGEVHLLVSPHIPIIIKENSLGEISIVYNGEEIDLRDLRDETGETINERVESALRAHM